MSEEIKDIILDVKDSLNETPKKMYKYNKITFNLNELSEILKYVEQLEKENIKQKEIIESLTTMTVCGDKKQIKNTVQYKLEQLENIRKEAIEYITSYESISTIQGLNDIEKNKILDEKTMNEMVNRYLKVHDILLNILNKGDNNE